MSTAALKRIEKCLEELSEQQAQVCERLAALEKSLAPAKSGKSASKKELMRFLDGFRAGEALGEASLGAWIEVCTTDAVRGALRTVQQREGMHARLLEARLKELGGAPKAEIPEKQYEQAMRAVGTTDKSDAEKLLEFTQRFPDPDAAIKPILDMAARADAETGALLRTIAQDERATLVCLGELCAELSA
jgi:hypothetical protein